MSRLFFTIGHSNHTIDAFIRLLTQHGVTVLADVRSHPYSRYYQHFRKAPLKGAIRKAGLGYVFLGKELGPRSTDPDCYIDNAVSYERLAQTSLFNQGLARLLRGAENHSIALMCAEQDPITCHRAILVSRPLHNQGYTVDHILRDGTLEPHADLEERLLALHSPNEPHAKREAKDGHAITQLDLLCPLASDSDTVQMNSVDLEHATSMTVTKQLDLFEDWLDPQLEQRRRAIATAYHQQGKKIAYQKE